MFVRCTGKLFDFRHRCGIISSDYLKICCYMKNRLKGAQWKNVGIATV